MNIHHLTRTMMLLGITVALLLALSACGPTGTPEQTAVAFWDTLVSENPGAIQSLVCDEYQENIGGFDWDSYAENMARAQEMLAAMGLEMEFEWDLSELNHAVITQQGDTAVVRTYGTVSIDTSMGEMPIPMPPMPVDQELPMRVENGRWKICGQRQ